MSISAQLRAAIEAREVTLYRIAKDSEVNWSALQRFVDGSRPDIRISTVDKLCACLGLELRPKKRERGRKRSR